MQSLDDLAHVQPAAAAQAHDLLAGLIGQGLGKFNWIYR
jgi:hypothetical protein